MSYNPLMPVLEDLRSAVLGGSRRSVRAEKDEWACESGLFAPGRAA